MDIIIEKSLKHSMTYQEYRDLLKQLVENKSTTGFEKTETNINYTKLNDRRMNRWDKTLKLDYQAIEATQRLHDHVTWLVIVESWCGDAAHVLPVINKLANENKNIDLRIVLRDENEDLMNLFLTDGTRSIPKLIMINDFTGEVTETYGPRPTIATNMVNEYKAKHGKLSPEFKEDLQRWYNHNKGKNIIEDLTKMLCGVEPSICQ
ncbi:thioredoxin family protein [Yeosuana sp. MJ-SS3]|jgi:thiol-disulfide isomerase/thioredoxin|uniref:Thioredoxin family protein n=1 Tax=Gilvirhabdus luticola TaxID=3079858 RepID=A0ABU3U3K7_9FLAO|nr:thioredoxin family protein [Yeosuana sp. MJ-SS3]MDU8884936.1 thioredoxin family protein [Yeosuana sp. MJ-SS3]